MTTPYASSRKRESHAEWLSQLALPSVAGRWPASGRQGFYTHERLWLARYHPSADVREFAQADLREREEARLASEHARRLAEEERARDRAARLEEIRRSLFGLAKETCGTVRGAALRASELYLSQHIPRTLKQCIAIAASEHLVAFWSVQAYLAGVGAGVLCDAATPAELWGEPDTEGDDE